MKKDKLLTIRMSQDEMNQLEDIAWGQKMKVSVYARSVLLGAPAKGSTTPLPTPIVAGGATPRVRADYEVVPNPEQL